MHKYFLNLSRLTGNSGIALVIVLWIMILLIVIVLSFSVTAKTELFSIMTFKEQTENKYLAEAGLQRGIMEIYYSRVNRDKIRSTTEEKPCRADGTIYHGRLSDGYYKFKITDESGKININNITDSSGIVLNNLLVNIGIEKEVADTIVDSILDWKDPDDLHRLHGAETDYYMSLPMPYKAKDGNFDNPEELLLVKGITPNILYGGGERKGLVNYITVHSGASQININTAAVELLKSIPLMSDDLIRKIMIYRSADNTQETVSELQAILTDNIYNKTSSFISMTYSNVYSLEVFGYKDEEKEKIYYPIKAIIMIDVSGRYRILQYQSPANIRLS